MYKATQPFTVPMFLFVPLETVNVKGSRKRVYPEKGELIFCNFRSFGGTEKVVRNEKNVNGILSVEDTAVIETWYRPDIRSDCMIKSEDGTAYEILNTPENISMRNQTVRIKVRSIKGGCVIWRIAEDNAVMI